jgi:hypothetical protein
VANVLSPDAHHHPAAAARVQLGLHPSVRHGCDGRVTVCIADLRSVDTAVESGTSRQWNGGDTAVERQ